MGTQRFACALGRSGTTRRKREGDGATPVFTFPLRRILWRQDRISRPISKLPIRAIRNNDGWCDAVGDRNYNRRVDLPYPASHEDMFRTDALYDLVVELGWNDHPRRQGHGSAIFMHIARDGLKPTEGCVALSKADARKILARLTPKTLLRVVG